MAVRNLRDPSAPLWFWDDINREVQNATNRNIRAVDIDGAVHLFRRYGVPTCADPILLLEGTENPVKPDTGQIPLLKSLALREGITVLLFVGALPYPPLWVSTFVEEWATASLPATGFWDKGRWDWLLQQRATAKGGP